MSHIGPTGGMAVAPVAELAGSSAGARAGRTRRQVTDRLTKMNRTPGDRAGGPAVGAGVGNRIGVSRMQTGSLLSANLSILRMAHFPRFHMKCTRMDAIPRSVGKVLPLSERLEGNHNSSSRRPHRPRVAGTRP